MSLLDVEDVIKQEPINIRSLQEMGFFGIPYSYASGGMLYILNLTFISEFTTPKLSYLYIYTDRNEFHIRFDCSEFYHERNALKYPTDVYKMYLKYKRWMKIKYIEDIRMFFYAISNIFETNNYQLKVTSTWQQL
jgi:hypothetical protein